MALKPILAPLLFIALVAVALLIPRGEDSQPPVAPPVTPLVGAGTDRGKDEPTPPARDLARLIRDLASEDDAVVLAAAKQFSWTELTNAEMDRVVPLLWRAFLADPDGDVDWEELRSMIGSRDLPRLVTSLPDALPRGTAGMIAGALHRMVLAEHLPSVAAKLSSIEDPEYRNDLIWDLVGIPLLHTSRHRETIARAILRHVPEPGAPRWEEPMDTRWGYPPLLTAALRRWSAGASPFDVRWLTRWLHAERPGPKDAEVLLDLLAFETDRETSLHGAALRALGYLSDRKSLEYLRLKCLKELRWNDAALGALARRGDKGALRALRLQVENDAGGLAVLLDVAPTTAAAALRKAVLGESDERALAALSSLRWLREEGYEGGYIVDPGPLAGIGDAARKASISGVRLAWIGAVLPGARTREIAVRACRAMLDEPDANRLLEERDVLAFLEIGAPDLLRRFLRKAARGRPGDTRELAREVLLRLGDPESGDVLVEFVRGRSPEDRYLNMLARSPGPEVETWLRETGSLGPLAVYYGLPDRLIANFAAAPDPDRVREFIRSRRPVDAVLELLRQEPDSAIWQIGLIEDERVRKWLELRRRQRRDYPWVTGELALMGDADAKKETWAALTMGRYRWVDEAGVEILTLSRDLSTIPHWIGQLESNCCRFNVVAQVFEELLGLPMDDYRSSPGFTAAEIVRDHWNRYGDHLVWSRITGHYVPGVR